jgi:methylphosphotriester-DNA--protein-cysteine methyltransferase
MENTTVKCSHGTCTQIPREGYKTCDRCREHNRKNHAKRTPEQIERTRKNLRNAFLLRKYGITLKQWEDLFKAQGECCGNPACRSITPGHLGTDWHTDHDHVTGRFRAILCHNCNLALGAVNDSIVKLQGLIGYLEPCRIQII